MTSSSGAAWASAHRAYTTVSAAPSVPAALSDAEVLAEALRLLASTESGREIADFLAADGVRITVMPDDEYMRKFPGSGAHFDPKTNIITTPRGSLLPASVGATTLAHEGRHAYDFRNQPHWFVSSLEFMAGGAVDAAGALVRAENPVTGFLDGLTGRQNEFEVNAYHHQARVAIELGLNQGGWFYGQDVDGSLRDHDEIRSDIAVADLYRMDATRRLLLSGGFSLAGVMGAGLAVELIAMRVAPGSFLAAHSWPTYVVGGVLAGAWLLGDQLRARRLDAQRDATPKVHL